MEDTHIVQLYWDRNETAISESSMKYGAYCTSIAQNILQNPADAEECVNDTWLHAWNAMPPHRPSLLSTFLGKITRNLSFDLYRKMHRKKRGESQMDAVLDELEECVSGKDDIERQWEMKELIAEINRFLQKLPEEKRPVGHWGRLHQAYLRMYRPGLYSELVLSCKLHTYLADLNEQATERCSLIIEQMAEAEGVDEALKASDQMLWVQSMNSIRSRAEEIIKHELIYD